MECCRREARRMPKRTREIWRNLIGQFERSGKTQEEFAAERQIPVGTLRFWIYKLKREKQDRETSILPVRVIASTAPPARRPDDESAAVEVLLVRFASGASSELIAEVVTRLRRC
jgi:hypothetical protein